MHSNAQGFLSPYSFSIDYYDNIYTLPTVASIKPTGQDVAGLVTELISEPGVCTPLITVRDTIYSSTEVPGLDSSQAPGSPGSGTVATPSTVTYRGRRKTESCSFYNGKKFLIPSQRFQDCMSLSQEGFILPSVHVAKKNKLKRGHHLAVGRAPVSCATWKDLKPSPRGTYGCGWRSRRTGRGFPNTDCQNCPNIP